MITLFRGDEADLSSNGLQILDPLIIGDTAVMHETLNGEYSLEMDLLPRALVRPEMLIKAPAPARDTPAISHVEPGTSRRIYRVNGGNVYMRTGPGTGYKAIRIYKRNTQMVLVSDRNASWYKVTAPDGTTGYMSSQYLDYVRTDTTPGASDVIEPHKAKEQIFRVVEVIPTLEAVHVRAVHWFYDLRRNHVASAATKGKSGAMALELIAAGTALEHPFQFYSDVGGRVENDFANINPAEAILGDGGLVEQLGGEVLRDNAEVYWTEAIGEDRGVTIAYRKNLTGMELDINTEDVATRIIPVGYDGEGAEVLLPETWVDSPIIGDYAMPAIRRIEYKDVKVGDDYASVSAVRAELRRRAAEEYSVNHVDKPDMTLKVQYVDLKNTSVGRNFQHYTNVYMGDTVRVLHEDYGIAIEAQMTEYDWDPVLEEYIECTFTNRPARLSDIWA
ncbi:MAG: phage tail protein [Oscillospiraceae bacterium]|nr:phage tail protein [Oscillospiraceae bacterium]